MGSPRVEAAGADGAGRGMATLECAHRKWGVGSGGVHLMRSPSNSATSHSTCAACRRAW